MSRWTQKVWEPNGHYSAPAPSHDYDDLHQLAREHGLFVLLRRNKEGHLVELGLSNKLGVELSDISEVDSAAGKLYELLAKEVSR